MKINGKPVVDAKKSLKITITDWDAVMGRTKDPGGCAAARAIMRGYKAEGVKSARVHVSRAYVEYPDKWVRYHTPNSLRAEIISFDRGTSPEFMRGNFTLEKIAPSDRLGHARHANPKGGNPASRKSVRKLAAAPRQLGGVRAKGANK